MAEQVLGSAAGPTASCNPRRHAGADQGLHQSPYSFLVPAPNVSGFLLHHDAAHLGKVRGIRSVVLVLVVPGQLPVLDRRQLGKEVAHATVESTRGSTQDDPDVGDDGKRRLRHGGIGSSEPSDGGERARHAIVRRAGRDAYHMGLLAEGSQLGDVDGLPSPYSDDYLGATPCHLFLHHLHGGHVRRSHLDPGAAEARPLEAAHESPAEVGPDIGPRGYDDVSGQALAPDQLARLIQDVPTCQHHRWKLHQMSCRWTRPMPRHYI